VVDFLHKYTLSSVFRMLRMQATAKRVSGSILGRAEGNLWEGGLRRVTAVRTPDIWGFPYNGALQSRVTPN
jgi:hypothetical protein